MSRTPLLFGALGAVLGVLAVVGVATVARGVAPLGGGTLVALAALTAVIGAALGAWSGVLHDVRRDR